MKKITISCVMVLCLAYNLAAQININVIGSFGTNISNSSSVAFACQPNQFNIQFNDTNSFLIQPGQTIFLQIEDVAFIEFPTLITLPNHPNLHYLQLFSNLSNTTDTFRLSTSSATFQMLVNCNIFAANTTQINISQHLGLAINGTPLNTNFNGVFYNNNIVNNEISYTVFFPYLSIANSVQNFDVNYFSFWTPTKNVERTLTYKNLGGNGFDSMDLNFNFSDTLLCSSFKLLKIEYTINSGSFDSIPTVSTDSSIKTTINTTIRIQRGDVLTIRETIHLVDSCLFDVCSAVQKIFYSNLAWGCADLCKNIPTQTKLTRGPLRPLLSINRMTPVPTSTLHFNSHDCYWDTFFSSQQIQNYNFVIANRGDDVSQNISVTLEDAIMSNMYFVTDSSDIQITPSFADLRNFHSSSVLYDTAGAKPYCVKHLYPNAIKKFEFGYDHLMPGDSIIVSVPLVYCCPSNDTLSSPISLNLFQQSKSLNTWSIGVSGKSGCTQAAPTSITANQNLYEVYGNRFSFNETAVTEADQLYLKQDYTPLTISFNPLPHLRDTCSSPSRLSLNNYQFNQNKAGLYRWMESNLFTKEFDGSDTVVVSGMSLRYRIKTEPGLRLDSNLANFYMTFAGKHWNVSTITSNHPDSCPLANIYTITFNDLNFPFTNPTRKHLGEMYDALNTGDFFFNMIGCCCYDNLNNNPNYVIETLIAGYDQCFIPMSSVLGSSEIHCPGCKKPGTTVFTSDDNILERKNFGYIDSNNDGLIDGLGRITAPYVAAHRGDLDLNHSMVGDTLSSMIKIKIDDGDTVRFSDLVAHNINLNYLFVEQKIEKSNSNQFDVHPIALTITAYNRSISINPNSPSWNLIVKDVRDSVGSSGKFDILFYNLSIPVLAAILNIPPFNFAGGDTITLQVSLHVCKNYQPNPDSKLLIDNQFNSKVSLNAYMCDVDLDALHIYDAYTHHNINYPLAQQDTGVLLPHNRVYMCEQRSAMHYFYSLYSKSVSSINQIAGQPCKLRFLIDYEAAIGGEKINPFKNEFRPIPKFLPIYIHLPGTIANYHFYNNDSAVSYVRTYYTSACNIPSLHKSTTFSTVNFDDTLNVNYTLANQQLLVNQSFSPTCGSPFSQLSSLFYSSDEYLKQTFSFPFTYTHCGLANSLAIDSSTVSTSLDVSTCSASSLKMYSKVDPINYGISSNFVTDFHIDPALLVSAIQNRNQWTLHVYNSNGNARPTRNLFIYLADTNIYSGVSIQNFTANHLLLPNGKHIVLFKIGNPQRQNFDSTFIVSMNINNCNLAAIPFYIGFDCFDYPTAQDIQNRTICQLDSGYFNLQILQPLVVPHIDQNVNDVTCVVDSINVLSTVFGSNIYSFHYKVDVLNPNLQIISRQITLYHNGNSTITTDSLVHVPNSTHYEIIPHLVGNELALGDTLKLKVVYLLMSPTNTSPFSVNYSYVNLCGNLIPAAVSPLVIGSYSCVQGVAHCFQVLASQNTVQCPGDTITLSSTINGNSAGLAYSWAIAGQVIGSGNTIHPSSPSVPTTYTVTASDASGNTASASITVNPILGQCCIPTGFNLSNGDILLNNTSSSAYIQQYLVNTISTLKKILIVGTFTVDSDFSFVSCTNMIMAPGAIIDVQQGVHLALFDSRMVGCSTMWQGINALRNAKIDMKGTTLEDALYGVNLSSHAFLKSVGCWFYNNYISINAVSQNSNSMNVGLTISSTQFGYTHDLAPKFIGQNPLPKRYPYAGINLSNILTVSIEPDIANLFQNLNMGIVANRTNISIRNCKFKNIINFSSYPQAQNLSGTAIYAKGGFTGYSLSYYGLNDTLLPDFENCYSGIKTKGMNLTAMNAAMKNVDVGIESARTNLVTVIISNNHIDCNLTGISLLSNLYPKSIVVTDNQVLCGIRAFQNRGPAARAIGIDLESNNYSQFGVNSLVANNDVQLFTNGAAGIQLNNSSNIEVLENFITLNHQISSPYEKTGIVVQSSRQLVVSCNSIGGTGSNQSGNTDEAAIRYESSEGNVLSQNVLNHTSQGIDVIGICTDGVNETRLEKNFFGFHYNGLRYHGSAVVNEQYHTGNQWLNPTNYPGYGAVNLDSVDAFFHKYKVKGGGNSMPTNRFPFGWFDGDGLPDPDIDTSDCNHYGLSTNGSIAYLLKLSDDSIKTIEFQQELNWQAKVKVYQQLIEHPEFLDASADLADFYIANAATAIHYIAQLNVEKENLLANQSSVVANLQNNAIDIYEKSQILKGLFKELDNVERTPKELDSLLLVIDQVSLTLDQRILLNDFYIAQLRSSLETETDLIGQLTDSIQGTELYELNEQQVNGIEAALYENSDDDVLKNFQDALYNIATQCPLTGGAAVFKARALYKEIDPTIFYDDAATCIQYGVVYKKRETEASYCALYPNPTTGTVMLSYSVPTDATLLFTDATGRVLLTKKIEHLSTSSTLDLSTFQNGLYLVRIYSNDGVLLNNKLILTK